MFTQTQGQALLDLAHRAIEQGLQSTPSRSTLPNPDPAFEAAHGVFVTLKHNGVLRGCIGSIASSEPLYQEVQHAARSAAFRDPRFPPVTAEEWPAMTLEVSVLSAIEAVADPEDIELGRHGVIVQKDGRSGVFLPQVARETGWDRETFLSTLCSEKAGLPSDAWTDPNTGLFVFTSEVFASEERQ